MTEDNRIPEIRAAMASEAWTTAGDAKTLRRIRAILDSDVPSPEEWQDAVDRARAEQEANRDG